MRNFIEEIDYDFIEILPFYERPFRAKFIPSRVWEDLDRYKNDYESLSNYCKKWRTSVKLHKRGKSKVFDNYVAVAGEYDAEDRRVTAFICEPKFNKFKFTDTTWKRFKYKFIQMLMHEFIHFMQFERRDGEYANYYLPYKKTGKRKQDEERHYLSNFDEIQAYAHCVLLDLKSFHPSKTVTDLTVKRRSLSPTFSYILRTFKRDHKNNGALNKVLQQVIKWDNRYKKSRVLMKKRGR